MAEEQSRKLQRLEGENQRLQEDLDKMEAKWKSAYEEYVRTDNEKCLLKDKLAREILRLRGENQTLREKWKEAERQIGSQADYEAVHNAVSEVQYKIAEYVNAINKTQQSLADTYQGMNSIKKKLAAKMTGEKKKQNKKQNCGMKGKGDLHAAVLFFMMFEAAFTQPESGK